MKVQHHLTSLRADIVGELDEDTGLALFRGIPYASVEKRWTHSQTRHDLETPFDATQFGPRCPQGVGEVLVTGGVTDPMPGDDEFKCLNLNVTVPKEALSEHQSGHPASPLPVLVWIHGGAFQFGAISVARYRTQALVSMAKKAGTPIILVQIAYRLGPFGFAASNDLISETTMVNGHDYTNGDYVNGDHVSRPVGNYGFIDQRNGLEWVRDHISDFGGDPFNVTTFGVSAGSASLHYHILAGDPLFDRAILMSGAAPSLGPLSFDYYEKAWEKLCNNSGVLGITPAERLKKLRSLSPADLVANYTKAALGPLGDGNILPSSWRLGDKHPATRCKSIILGDTRVEALIWEGLFKATPQSQFHKLARSAFTTDAETFLNYFGFTASDNLPFEQYRDAMRFFFSVAMFQYPNYRIADSFSRTGDAYYYHFEEPSPYPGPTFGLPYHGQCALFLYQNECAAYPDAARQTAEDMGRRWIAFTSGEQPWEPYSKSGHFMRFGPGGKSEMKDTRSDDCRRYEYLDWLADHWDQFKELGQSLLHRV